MASSETEYGENREACRSSAVVAARGPATVAEKPTRLSARSEEHGRVVSRVLLPNAAGNEQFCHTSILPHFLADRNHRVDRLRSVAVRMLPCRGSRILC